MRRIDNTPNTISIGYNFRNVDYDPTQTHRVLKKLTGLRFVFIVEGRAGKFDWLQLSITLGAGLGYIGIASIVTDIVLENFLPESSLYLEHKEKPIRHKGKDVLSKATVAGHLESQLKSSRMSFRKKSNTGSLSIKFL